MTRRLSSHKSEALRKKPDGSWVATFRRVNWIRSLIAKGMWPPTVTILETYQTLEETQKAEIRHIAAYKQQGADLVNGTEGGEGVKVTYTPERLLRLTASARRYASNMTEEQRRELSERTKIQMTDPVRREALRKQNKERLASPEARKTIADRQQSYFAKNPEHKAKACEALLRGVKRTWSDPELRAKALERAKTNGKLRRGEKAANAKLTPEAVREIRKAAESPYRGMTRDLSRKFKVDKSLIRHVVLRKIWTDI